MVVNLENALKFPFKDQKWIVKILIGGLLLWIPIVNFIVFGYLLKILADAKDKKEPVLHEWKDWGSLFQEGFMAFVVFLCYLVPLFILGLIPIFGYVFRIATSLILGPLCSVALCFYLEKKEIGSAFNFKAIIEKIKAHVVDYLIIALLTGVAMAVTGIGLIGAILIFPLILVMSIWFYIILISYRLYGELFSA